MTVREWLNNERDKRGGAEIFRSFLFFFIACAIEVWRLMFYYSEYFDKTKVNWFISSTYRKIAAEFSLYMWIREFTKELALVAFASTGLYLINLINTTYRSGRVTEQKMLRLLYFAQTVAIAIFIWTLMDCMAFLWNYKTSRYFFVYLIVEGIVFWYRILAKAKDTQL